MLECLHDLESGIDLRLVLSFTSILLINATFENNIKNLSINLAASGFCENLWYDCYGFLCLVCREVSKTPGCVS